MKTFLAVLGVIGRVLGWIGILIGALILILLLLCLFPLRLDVEWDRGTLTADAGYLFINKRIAPSAKKEKKTGKKRERPEKTEEKEPAAPADAGRPEAGEPPQQAEAVRPEAAGTAADKREGEKKKGESGSFRETWEKIRPFIDPGTRAVRHLARHVNVKNLSVRLESVASDAAVVGMLTGAKWAFLGEMSAVLNSLFGGNITYGSMEVVPCWTKDMSEGERAACRLRFRPIFAVGAGIIFLAGWLPSLFGKKEKQVSEVE